MLYNLWCISSLEIVLKDKIDLKIKNTNYITAKYWYYKGRNVTQFSMQNPKPPSMNESKKISEIV